MANHWLSMNLATTKSTMHWMRTNGPQSSIRTTFISKLAFSYFATVKLMVYPFRQVHRYRKMFILKLTKLLVLLVLQVRNGVILLLLNHRQDLLMDLLMAGPEVDLQRSILRSLQTLTISENLLEAQFRRHLVGQAQGKSHHK